MASATATLFLMLTLAAAPPQVQTTTLDGRSDSGALQTLSATELVLLSDGQPRTMPAADLLEVRIPPPDGAPALTAKPPVEVHLVDGSVISCAGYDAGARNATFDTVSLGTLELAPAAVRSVRLAPAESKVNDAWTDLRTRDTRNDLLIVRKGDALDFVSGVIGEVTGASVTLLLNEREVQVPRDRVFGVVYARTAPERGAALCELSLAGGDRLRLQDITFADDAFTATLSAGPKVAPPVDQVRVIDFGLGRVRYLADLEETAAYQPIGILFPPSDVSSGNNSAQWLRKNRTSNNERLKVGRKTYDRGLWVHSGTTLTYRLGRDYRRLQAVMGIDRNSSECARFNPRVQVTVLGDGKPLLDSDVAWGDEPRALDLDVSGVRDLEIRVLSPGNTLGACEHLALADARVIR